MNTFSYRCVVLAAVLLTCGCYRPYQPYGWQGQPGYYPPQPGPGQFQAPGQLVIPESNDPLSAPGTSPREYEDDFDKPGSYYGEDDVPPPQESGGGGNRLDDDYRGPGGF